MKTILPFLVLLIAAALFGCGYNNDAHDAGSLSDSTSLAGVTADSLKLVKTAGIHFKVKDVSQTCKAISELAAKLGGMIYDQNIEAAEGGRKELKVSEDSLMVMSAYTPQASITARIPASSLETFMYSVADLGYFTGSNTLHIDDKSLAYLENALRLKNRMDVLGKPVSKVQKTGDRIKEIGIKDDMVAQQLANRSIDADVQFSTVNLSLFQNPVVRKEMVANYEVETYQLSFHRRMANAMMDGWQYFLSFLLVLGHLWVFILLIVTSYLVYRYILYKSKMQLVDVKVKE